MLTRKLMSDRQLCIQVYLIFTFILVLRINCYIFKASISGHLETVELLINKGADVNDSTHYRFTPLHEASRRGYKEIIELLVNKGAFVNAQTNNKITPLHSGIHIRFIYHRSF